MNKYKLCPGCGFHNNPLAIECEQCGEDLASVRILDERTEEQMNEPNNPDMAKPAKMVRICEECGTKNEPQARKCSHCGEDISMVLPTPDTVVVHGYSLASTDGEFTFSIPETDEPIIIGRENEMEDYLKNKLYVSRSHASLVLVGGKLQIKGFPSAANGTHINGVMIKPNQDVELNEGDIVGLGGNNPDTQSDAAYFRVIKS